MKEPKVVVLGSINVDMSVKVDRIPAKGETVTGGKFFRSNGGKGANQAVAAARLGAEVSLVSKVGDDVFGRQSLQSLQAEAIDTSMIMQDSDTPTGVALIMVDRLGDNVISVASGANHEFSVPDLKKAENAIMGADVLLVQLELPIDVVASAVDMAAAASVPVILDPAPAPTKPLPAALLKKVACVTPNTREATQLSGIKINDEKSAITAANCIREMGVSCAIITMGNLGAVVSTVEGVSLLGAPEIECVDSTAAGDAFAGALAVWWKMSAASRLRSAELACFAGAYSAARQGAQDSLPTVTELEIFCKGYGRYWPFSPK